MSLPPTYTSAEVAAHLHRSHRWVLDQARQRPDRFPHLKVGRRVVFTAGHVAAIEAALLRLPSPQVTEALAQESEGWGRPSRAVLRQGRARSA